MKRIIALLLFTASVASAQVPTPQINLTGNIGCQGFPCVNTGTLIMASDANRTVTATETSAFSMKVISSVALTVTRNLIYPVGRFPVDVENATSGGQAIQVIGASGTGVTIPNGLTVRVWNDGTNFVQVGVAGGGGAVASVFGRTGAVAAASGDYSSFYCLLTGCAFTGSTTFAGTGVPIKIPDAVTYTGDVGFTDIQSLLATHRPQFNPNAVGWLNFAGVATAGTLNDCVKFAANGIDLVDAGAACGAGGGAPAFNTITSGTNTTAAMVVGAGSTLNPASTGVVNANQINAAVIPVSTAVLGTNGAGQFVNGSGGISAALSTGSGMQISGDSICAGTGASNVFTNAFAYLLRPVIGGFWNANCRPGDQLIDTTSSYINTYIAPSNDGHYPLAMIEDGTNDVTQYNTDANKQISWQQMYLADIATNGIAFAQKTYPALSLTGWTATGAWAGDTTQNGMEGDYVSTTNGNTLAYAANCGASSCVGILDFPMWSGNGGTFTVSVDGTPIVVTFGSGTTFYSAGFNGVVITAASPTGATFSKGAARIPMTSGAHTVTVTVTSVTSIANKVGVNYFAIIPKTSNTNPNVEAISLQHQNNANDTLSGTYTNYVSAMVTQAATDGLNVYYANVRDAMLNTSVPINYNVAAAGISFVAPQWVSGTSVAYASNGTLLTVVGSAPTQGQYAVAAGTYTFNVADSNTPLIFNFTTNCGATLSAMYANCYADALHPNDLGHAVYASVITAALPARLVTGNNVPQSTYPYRNYLATRQFPSQMMSPSSSYNLTNIPAGTPGFYPGINWNCYAGQCSFETMTTNNGLTTAVPNTGSSTVWSVATYPPQNQQPSSESQLTPMLTLSGNGTFTSNTSQNNFNGNTVINEQGTASYRFGLKVSNNSPYVANSTLILNNTYSDGRGAVQYIGTGASARIFQTGVGNDIDSTCGAVDKWFLADQTSGCVLRETIDLTGVHKFLAGITSTAVTDSALTSGNCVQASTGGLLASGTAGACLTIGPTATFTAGGAAGTAPTITIVGSGAASSLSVQVGTAPPSTGTIVTGNIGTRAGLYCTFSPGNAAAAGVASSVWITAGTGNSYSLITGAALVASTVYYWSVVCP